MSRPEPTKPGTVLKNGAVVVAAEVMPRRMGEVWCEIVLCMVTDRTWTEYAVWIRNTETGGIGSGAYFFHISHAVNVYDNRRKGWAA